MKMPRARRDSTAFTLIEVLVAATILVVMVGFMIVVMDQTTRIWSGSSAKVEQFREARSAFERVTTRLSQATLNTYWAYDDDKKPTRYLRQSELRFIAGSAPGLLGSTGPGNTARVAHTVFFNAPLGITANANYTGLENALNTIGYFVELGDDSAQRPDFMKSMVDAIPLRWRFRLMEFSQPTENFSLYQWTSGTPGFDTSALGEWYKTDVNNEAVLKRVVAENVIAFVVTPRLAKAEEILLQTNPTHSPLAPFYSYDSTSTNADRQLNPKNQLPPVVQLTMVAVDEKSAARLGLSSAGDSDVFGLSTLFSDTKKFASDPETNFVGDLATLEKTLATKRVRYRVFTTNVQIRAAKWSREQIQ
jgi:uncharacterized protein (TIGR02599 family)